MPIRRKTRELANYWAPRVNLFTNWQRALFRGLHVDHAGRWVPLRDMVSWIRATHPDYAVSVYTVYRFATGLVAEGFLEKRVVEGKKSVGEYRAKYGFEEAKQRLYERVEGLLRRELDSL